MAFSWNPSLRQAVVFHSSRLESDLSNSPKNQDSFDFFISKKNSSVSVAKMLHLERYQNSTHEASEGLNPCQNECPTLVTDFWDQPWQNLKRFSRKIIHLHGRLMSEIFDEEIPNGSEKNKKANKTWKRPVFLLLSIVEIVPKSKCCFLLVFSVWEIWRNSLFHCRVLSYLDLFV